MSGREEIARSALVHAEIHRTWVAAYRTPEAQRFYEMAFDELLRQLEIPAGATILDAGCGSCAKSILLAARGARVVGTDFSPEALRLAAETVRAHALSDRIALRHADLLRLPFDDGEFRYILCWGVLMHVPELQRALAELSRVLAPGGLLIVSEGNMHSLQAVAMRTARRLLGRGRGRVARVPAGLESHEETSHGTLLTRQTDIGWFVAACAPLGLSLRVRRAGQLTEMYKLAPWRWLRRVIHAVNHVWFRHVRLPRAAFGNILVFEKLS